MKGEAGHMLHNENPNQEGHTWGSMRRTAFILGSGLLLLMAHWNCVTGHLQRFWGVSGYFWQAQWERLLSTFEGKEWLLYILGVTQVPLLVYWTFSGLLLVADVTGKPNFISRYRIQVSNNDRVDPMKLRQSILMILFNQFVISLPMLVSLYPILKLWGDPCHRERPTFHWFLLELVVFTLIKLMLFYYSHREALLHHPKLYKKIHKKHHEWTVPIAATCLSVHPIEHVINMLLAILGPTVMGSPLSSFTTCISLALTFTMISHCGYHLPFLPSPEFHDYQHQKVDQCYGALGMLDYCQGTDTVFKQAKAYKRHMILLGFTPLSESIPDPLKMMD
ncbi:fatty acid hydroxylase domain-containing protein 2 [Dama dama]|uniref:fatty acid hydroxylase domain-containing protein 2 n=1 Tax=Dama dama TaxID=30532 RepID=UPI002A36CCD9|nr:fatty acid hydroxylase domain-containing protein 2 [Dama dama]